MGTDGETESHRRKRRKKTSMSGGILVRYELSGSIGNLRVMWKRDMVNQKCRSKDAGLSIKVVPQLC